MKKRLYTEGAFLHIQHIYKDVVEKKRIIPNEKNHHITKLNKYLPGHYMMIVL
jgi:hypothetical protein